MIDRRCSIWALVLAASLSPLACAGQAEEHGEEGEAEVATASSALAASDTVATAVAQSCTTTAVKGLAMQLVEEIQCLRPNTFARIDNTPGLALGSAVFPYLQTKAAQGLVAAQKARGTTMSINSALRTLPQQFLLYRWYQTGRCGIGLAASPGTSNHEGAIAVDIDDTAGWRASMTTKTFIPEDGLYGGGTATRLEQSPVGGFATGANCSPSADAGADAGESDAPATTPSSVPAIPDATEGNGEGDGGNHGTGSGSGSGNGPQTRPTPEATGCTVSAGPRDGKAPTTPLGLGFLAAMLALARRRQVRSAREQSAPDGDGLCLGVKPS